MKKIVFVLPVLLFSICTFSQQLNQVTLNGASTLSSFSFITDQSVLIRISPEGRIIDFGTEMMSERSTNYFAPKLQPFLGRTDNYPADADSAYRGKLRSIGTTTLTYYSSLEKDDKAGKLKSIGSVMLDYYTQFDNAAFKGKLRFIGTTVLEYYAALENEAIRGKLKTVGNTKLVYHTTFDDKMLQGKVKVIGNTTLNWGNSLDPRGQKGVLKSGSYRQHINGVTYILQ